MNKILNKRERQYDLMILPGSIFLFVFGYIPLFGLLMAFKDYTFASGIFDSKWVGFDNFISFFKDIYFIRTLKNTILLGVFTLIFTFPMPIILALLLNEMRSVIFKRTVQTITYLPYFVSTVIIIGLMKTIFDTDGIINQILVYIGLEKIQFFGTPQWFRPMYILSIIWQNTGYSAIIYLAAMAGIDKELYDACKIDGANRWQTVWKITLPCIMPTILTLFILSIGGILGNDFERVFLMQTPLTYDTSDVISTYVYRSGIRESRFSYATAVGMFNSTVSLALLWGANYLSKKISDTKLW